MMAEPIIYESPLPSVPVYQCSVFTHLFYSTPGSDKIGGYPASCPAFIDAASGYTISRQQLKSLAFSFGFGLLSHPQLVPLRRGDTLLIYSPNTIAYPVVLFGAVAAGLRCSPSNSGYTSGELEHQFVNSGSRVVVTSEDGLDVVKKMFEDLRWDPQDYAKSIIVIPRDLHWLDTLNLSQGRADDLLTLHDMLHLGSLEKEESFDGPLSSETCYICYSSGTTGKPKGVETTHANLTTVIDIGQSVLVQHHGRDRVLGVLPFYHIYGAVALLHVPFWFGVPVVVQSRFDPALFCANIQKFEISTVMVVPPILVVLGRHPVVDSYDLKSLRLVFCAAAPLGSALIHQVARRLRERGTNLTIMQGYGLTETSPISHMLPPSSAYEKAGSIGVLLPTLQARIVSNGDGDVPVDALVGSPGELWLRGPTIMKGYLGNTKATSGSITKDGWFKSGDVCVRDEDGYYWIVDRRKELIKYKAFPPSELESVLLTHPSIADVAVIGVDDSEEATELPRAYIVHAHPDEIEVPRAKAAFVRNVNAWLEQKVANHKLLRGGISIVNVIPKSAAGKILRRELRELAKAEMLTEKKLSRL